MVLARTKLPNQRYLVCMAWRESQTCSNEWVRFPEIEDVFVSDVRHLIQRCPQPRLHVEARRAMLKSVTDRLFPLADEAEPGERRSRHACHGWPGPGGPGLRRRKLKSTICSKNAIG